MFWEDSYGHLHSEPPPALSESELPGFVAQEPVTLGYDDYMHSVAWRLKRSLVLERAQGVCEWCGDESQRLDVHHKSYEHFCQEPLSDLMAVCQKCHPRVDELRLAMDHIRRKEKAKVMPKLGTGKDEHGA